MIFTFQLSVLHTKDPVHSWRMFTFRRSWVGAPGLDPWQVSWRSGGWFPTWPRIACGGYWSWNFLCLGAKNVEIERIMDGFPWGFHYDFTVNLWDRHFIQGCSKRWIMAQFFGGKLVVLPRFLGVVLGNSGNWIYVSNSRIADIHMFWVASLLGTL